MKFTYPDKLYDILKDRYSKKRYKDEFIPDLPSKDIVEEMIDVVFHSSFLTEESRRIWFRVIYINPEEDEDKAKFREINHIKFKSQRDFKVSELIKLAPAADPTQILIGVYSYGNQLKIWGLIDSGISALVNSYNHQSR